MSMDQEIAQRLIRMDAAAVAAIERIRAARRDPTLSGGPAGVPPEQYLSWRKGLRDALEILRPLWELHEELERWRTCGGQHAAGNLADQVSEAERAALAAPNEK